MGGKQDFRLGYQYTKDGYIYTGVTGVPKQLSRPQGHWEVPTTRRPMSQRLGEAMGAWQEWSVAPRPGAGKSFSRRGETSDR
jgi:hypothetical protein